VLEPLAVDTDGVTVAPVPVWSSRTAVWRDAVAVAVAVARSWIDDLAGGAPVGQHGSSVTITPAPLRPATQLPPMFVRMIDVDARTLGLLADWWGSPARRRVARGTGWSFDELHSGDGGAWRLRGRMRRNRLGLGRRVPFDLVLWPHLGAFTKVVLEPRRRVHVSRRYFRRGHRALDRLVRELESLPQAPRLGRCPP